MSAFAWLVSLAPLPVGSGQCLVFFPRLLFSACSFRCAWRFSRYSPQNGAEERYFDLLSRGQWGIKRSELLVRAHNWRLECGVESSRLWSTRDQGSNIACSEKKAKKPFPSVNNVFALRRPTFTFKYNPNLWKQKAQITVRFNFRREFAQSFVDEIFMTFKDQNYFLNYICFIFIHLANKAFQITVKTPDVVHFEFLDLS